MRLTCCCGASIETDVPEFKLAMQTTLGEPRTIVDRFKADHAECLDHWRAEIHRSGVWGKSIADMASEDLRDYLRTYKPVPPAFHSAPLVEFTKEALAWMQTFPGMIPTFKLSIDDARKMVSFEKKAAFAPDPYARFRAAIREGKRVFRLSRDGKMELYIAANDTRLIGYAFEDKVEVYFIESVDIPVQPTQDWLDEIGYESSGECRAPKPGEQYCAITDSGIVTRRVDIPVELPHFSGRRWIVRKKQADDGFEKWYEENKLSLAFETNPRYSHTVLKRTWTAAQKAKP